VSHHPPVAALYCQGNGFTLSKLSSAKIRFTGKAILMTDNNRYYVNLDVPNGGVENFSMETPKVVVGNLIIGESYTEP
jgi:hypothetical protein